jgi:predicted esterase
LKSQSAKCPNQKYALVGYSQGAGVMHQAMSKIDSSLYPKIIALVMFGDFGKHRGKIRYVWTRFIEKFLSGNKGVNVKSIFGTTDPAFPPLLAQRLKQNCITGDPVSVAESVSCISN